MTSSLYKFAEEVVKRIKVTFSRMSIVERVVFLMLTPLTVNIVTDQGDVSLAILKDGTVQLSKCLSSNPDNTIKANLATLKNLYDLRDRNQFMRAETEGRIKITSNSPKGQKAERKIRELLGY